MKPVTEFSSGSLLGFLPSRTVTDRRELVQGDGGIDQLLSYDATFSMGDFYVSILIFRHTFFVKNPCVPALFLIHERKFEE